MAGDAHGLPLDFEITGGEVHDCNVAPEFIEKLPVADKGYDSEEVRDAIRKKSSIPVIPRKSNSKIGNDGINWCLYKYRHLVENLFARIKHFRGLATRFDKLKRNYVSCCSYGLRIVVVTYVKCQQTLVFIINFIYFFCSTTKKLKYFIFIYVRCMIYS